MDTVQIAVETEKELRKKLLAGLREEISSGYKFKSDEARDQFESEIEEVVYNVGEFMSSQLRGLTYMLEDNDYIPSIARPVNYAQW